MSPIEKYWSTLQMSETGCSSDRNAYATSAEDTLPCWAEGLHHHPEMRSIAHMSLHQEETRTPQGVHCPETCLPSQRRSPSRVLQAHHSRMLHLLACLPLLPYTFGAEPQLPTQLGITQSIAL